VSDPSLLDDFEARLGFTPDPFQHRAIDALSAGRSVLVAAPTGAGKTVVGEFACHEALHTGGRAFYTTPIKALSNQKHRDLARTYGEANVGLLTGDRSVNGGAPIVVMTTEVLRNMIYEASAALHGLRSVVLDEVHYLADRSRGAVWEEVIIQLDQRVKLAALSATVSNAEDVGRWLDEVRDGCEVVIEEHRPVPLRHHYFVNQTVYDTFRAGRKGGATREHREAASQALGGIPNPDVLMLEKRARTRNRVSGKGRRLASDVKLRWPSRPQVIAELAERRWLPAIQFVFSRQGCEDAVSQLLLAGVRLTDAEQREQIAAIVDSMVVDLPEADLKVLGFPSWRAGLLDGIAAHHAGMVPIFKEVVEVLFQRGLLQLVVATETLALGINMPARTVIIERLEKWNGESHVLLTPGEYTQLTGRAGRRGIDRVGHAVVLYQRDLDFRTVAGLVGTRAYPLHSSFAPSYNMAVNLLRRHDLREAEDLLGASFAQFEADASVARTSDRLEELEEGKAGYAQHLTCHLGDWPAYWQLRREASRREKREAKERRRAAGDRVRDAIAGLRPGDVLHVPWLGKRGLAAVVGVHLTKKGTPIAQLVVDDRSLTKLGPREMEAPPVPVERIRLPGAGNPRQSSYRHDVGVALRQLDPPGLDVGDLPGDPHQQRGPSAEVVALQEQLRAHPCHACPDRADHERWQHRFDRLDDEARDLRQRISARTGNLVRQLHRILRVLDDLDYVADPDGRPPGDHRSWAPQPTDAGRTLAGIYSEVDLLVAEALRRGLLDDLDPDELAGVAALFLYTPRGGEPTEDAELPTLRLYEVAEELFDLADELRGREQAAGVRPLRDLDAGFVAPAWRWAGGADLDDALGRLELTGGDFVRNIKQVADLVGQLRSVGDEQLARDADRALDGLRRGIVES
jgi:ATP-dependent RNA helicase HelY